ncbi:hypothetical protein BDW71DRAFT_173288 [Aspergillus fruticulosus]
MEHIPRVRDSKLQTANLTVPYLADTWEYGSQIRGFESFQLFPEQHGFDQKLSDSCLNNPSVEFLQAWLYLGLLAEAFGTAEMKFDPEHFIDRSAHTAVISTKELNRYIWYWAAAVAHGVRDEIDDHSANLDKCLELANAVVNDFSRHLPAEHSEKEEEGWSTTTTILFSIITLVDYLRRARIDINMYSWEVNLPALEWDFPLLDQALSAAGWCEAEISRLNSQTDCSTRFYLAQIDRWMQGKDHSRCIAGQGCQAHQIYEPTYKTRHRPDCKGEAMCWAVGPVVEDVVSTLAEGAYPLVNLSRDGRGVDVHPVQEGHVYVTISHVWSDGLGNPHGNTLPYCQLAYIQGLVNALCPESSRPVKFWLDTICIPVGDRHSPFRRIAINRMHETFRASQKTLALDNSLMAQRTDTGMDWVEMNTRIKYCPWVTRAWTLLEGRVGKELLFQFKDSAVSSNFVFDRSYAERNMLAVCSILEDRGVQNVLNEPNAIRLARALTLLPKDSDSNSDSNSTAAKAYNIWMPILQNAGHISLSDIDDDMSVNIQTRVFCPVTKHSNSGTRNIRDEFWLENIISSREDSKTTGTPYGCHAFFEGVSRGFRGRTASKAEDETICFGQMMGIDTSQITAIKPLEPRAKYWLTLIDSSPLLNMLAWTVGIDARGRLMECQVKRIQTLLTHVERLPLTILLWDVPRIQAPGWKWAPLSLLDTGSGSEGEGVWSSNERGIVRPDGLVVSFPELWLKAPAADEARAADMEISILDPVYFTVTTADDGVGPVGGDTTTFRIRMSFIPSEWKRYRTWSAFIKAGMLDKLAILTRRRASIHDPFKHKGVLVEVRERKDESEPHMAHYRGVVEKPHEHEMLGEKLPVVYLDGGWDIQSKWCVG